MKFEKQTYTQVPNSLFLVMKDMDECELKVVMLICRYTFGYHREEVKLSTRRIADEIGMNTASVQKGADAAVERGLIEKVIDGNKTTTWRAVVGDSESDTQVIQNLTRGDSKSESQLPIKESIKKDKEEGVPPNYGLDWKIANGQEITEKDLEQTDQERIDTANLIATGTGINSTAIYNLAYAFMTARQITIPFEAVKGNRKAAVEMLKMKVTPFHVVEATKKLLEAKMTVTDLFSIKKTAIDLANPAPEQSGYNPQGLDLS